MDSGGPPSDFEGLDFFLPVNLEGEVDLEAGAVIAGMGLRPPVGVAPVPNLDLGNVDLVADEFEELIGVLFRVSSIGLEFLSTIELLLPIVELFLTGISRRCEGARIPEGPEGVFKGLGCVKFDFVDLKLGFDEED
jgi:hypothetical protein